MFFASGLGPLFLLSFYEAPPESCPAERKGRRLVSADRVIKKAEEFARPIAEEMGLELVEVEFRQESGGWVLRLFIDREQGGVNVDDCASVSRQLAARLEAEDIINHAYTLEVSSPGAERPLKRMEDFVRFVGRRAKIKLKEPVNGEYAFFGLLAAADMDNKQITLAADQAGQMTIDLEAVAKARLSL
jgi:ribosome maturation factor RimP